MEVKSKKNMVAGKSYVCFWCNGDIHKGDECRNLRVEGKIIAFNVTVHQQCENFRYLYGSDIVSGESLQDRADELAKSYNINREGKSYQDLMAELVEKRQ